MKTAPVLTVLLAAIAMVAADVARMAKCQNVDQSLCHVSELRVSPCNMKKGACQLKRGRDVHLSFDFQPNFAANELKTAAYYPQAGGVELIFETLGVADACQFFSCPIAPGDAKTFNYNLHIGKLLPPGTFPLRWKIWNVADETQLCCFESAVTLI